MTNDQIEYFIRECQKQRRSAFASGVLFGLIVGCIGTVIFLDLAAR